MTDPRIVECVTGHWCGERAALTISGACPICGSPVSEETDEPVIVRSNAVRLFAPRCSECRQKSMQLTPVAWSMGFQHNGEQRKIDIPDLIVPKCRLCGSISIDQHAGEQIESAIQLVRSVEDFDPMADTR